LEHILPISSATQTDAAQSIVSARGPARKAKVRARHALTAAITNLKDVLHGAVGHEPKPIYSAEATALRPPRDFGVLIPATLGVFDRRLRK
jgi:hypothetical protein